MTEAELLQGLAEALEFTGWTWTHIIRSDGVTQGRGGIPDLLAGRTDRPFLLAWELKGDKGQLTPDQVAWMLVMRVEGIDVRVIRPADYDKALEVSWAPWSPSPRPRSRSPLCIGHSDPREFAAALIRAADAALPSDDLAMDPIVDQHSAWVDR